jgi:hypothetical protein
VIDLNVLPREVLRRPYTYANLDCISAHGKRRTSVCVSAVVAVVAAVQ